tara:strand:+ start:915 stop:1493 length:579 start_codon:yes stop_codon:yes gene_type:complete
MLGLGGSTSLGNYSAPNSDDNGYFEKSYALDDDIKLLRFKVTRVAHATGTPGILVRNFKVLIQGLPTPIELFSQQLVEAAETVPVVVHNGNSISFDDNVGDDNSNNIVIYQDRSSDSGIFAQTWLNNSAGRTVTISGNITKNDGTNRTYAGHDEGRLQIELNDTEADHLFVYLEPGVTAAGEGNAQTVVVAV